MQPMYKNAQNCIFIHANYHIVKIMTSTNNNFFKKNVIFLCTDDDRSACQWGIPNYGRTESRDAIRASRQHAKEVIPRGCNVKYYLHMYVNNT